MNCSLIKRHCEKILKIVGFLPPTRNIPVYSWQILISHSFPSLFLRHLHNHKSSSSRDLPKDQVSKKKENNGKSKQKTTVRGTNVRSEVCDAGCFCLESLIIMRHVSCIIHHTSCVMYHVSCVMCVMCNLKFSFMCHLSCLICHLSCVICHVSCVISCHLKFRVI